MRDREMRDAGGAGGWAMSSSAVAAGAVTFNRATAQRNADGRWAALAVICMGVILSMTPWFSATAILPELKAHWHVSDALAAWLTNAVQLGFVTGALLSSLTGLPDLVRPHRLMAVSALLAAALNLALLIAPGGETAVLIRFLTGMALSGVYPPAMCDKRVEPRRRLHFISSTDEVEPLPCPASVSRVAATSVWSVATHWVPAASVSPAVPQAPLGPRRPSGCPPGSRHPGAHRRARRDGCPANVQKLAFHGQTPWRRRDCSAGSRYA